MGAARAGPPDPPREPGPMAASVREASHMTYSHRSLCRTLVGVVLAASCTGSIGDGPAPSGPLPPPDNRGGGQPGPMNGGTGGAPGPKPGPDDKPPAAGCGLAPRRI